MVFKALPMVFLGLVLCCSALATSARAETLNLVAFGDSLTAGYELPAEDAFPARLEKALKARGHDVAITNAGVSGDTSADGLARADWSIPDGTHGVILELGANDALRGLAPEETEKNIDAILVRLKERNIPVMLAGILAPPNMGSDYAARFNPIYPRLSERYQLILYPFFLDGVIQDEKLKLADGMHPTAEGVGIMVERFVPTAERFLVTLTSQ